MKIINKKDVEIFMELAREHEGLPNCFEFSQERDDKFNEMLDIAEKTSRTCLGVPLQGHIFSFLFSIYGVLRTDKTLVELTDKTLEVLKVLGFEVAE